jgi:hypothetical protein
VIIDCSMQCVGYCRRVFDPNIVYVFGRVLLVWVRIVALKLKGR